MSDFFTFRSDELKHSLDGLNPWAHHIDTILIILTKRNGIIIRLVLSILALKQHHFPILNNFIIYDGGSEPDIASIVEIYFISSCQIQPPLKVFGFSLEGGDLQCTFDIVLDFLLDSVVKFNAEHVLVVRKDCRSGPTGSICNSAWILDSINIIPGLQTFDEFTTFWRIVQIKFPRLH